MDDNRGFPNRGRRPFIDNSTRGERQPQQPYGGYQPPYQNPYEAQYPQNQNYAPYDQYAPVNEDFSDQFDYSQDMGYQIPSTPNPYLQNDPSIYTQQDPHKSKKKGWFSNFMGKKTQQDQPSNSSMNGVIFFAPKRITDLVPIVNALKSGKAAIVDFSKAPEQFKQRCLDYLSGAIFALGGYVEHISDSSTSFLYTPNGVGIQGPLKK